MDIDKARSMADNLADLRDDVKTLGGWAAPNARLTYRHATDLLDRLHVQLRTTDVEKLRLLLVGAVDQAAYELNANEGTWDRQIIVEDLIARIRGHLAAS